MRVDLFDFDLPEDRISDHPSIPRDSARMLHVPVFGALADVGVRDLPGFLTSGDALIINDTRVIPTRLWGRRGAARIEATLLKPVNGGWRALAKPGKRLRQGEVIAFDSGICATVAKKDADGTVLLVFDLTHDALIDHLNVHGAMPLPPYIARDAVDPSDRNDYQTAFAREAGAVAAPTAGLHFTERLLADIRERGVTIVPTTLHVGAGTFLPVKVDDTDNHVMHSEWGRITEESCAALNAIRKAGGRWCAVGSTALRLLETAADEDGVLHPCQGETDIFITPGYRFKTATLMMTNFHLPRSTLFMLVSAFAGLDRMQNAYAHAMECGYRFYSYGDACLLER
ncbi:MAG: tRNA preQ1(34) S-adenosylmethionine ribosyltransferase-isomerase QueA [Pseudomonadota bacterium]|nr:tRNA preQ1(34) S-adenosylmethionine ribosyltransferase-isomerase QueA [Pseudomonadota bacterium]